MFKDINKLQQDIIDAERKANPDAFKLIDTITQRRRSKTRKQTDKAMELLSFTSGPDDYSNFTTEQAQENIFNQLMHQKKAMEQRGYRYPYQKDINLLYTNMSKDLANSGIKDIRQLAVDEIETDPLSVRVRYGKGDQLYEEVSGPMASSFRKVKNPEEFFDIEGVKGEINTAKKKAPTAYGLINKETGEKVIQGKYAGNATLYDENQGYRWGNTTSVEGMADHMIVFTPDGDPVIYPRYQDTKSDLTGIMMVASVATMGLPIAQSIGTAATAGAVKGAAAKAIGNVIVNGTLNELQGGDFFDNVVTSAGVPFVQKGLDIALSNSIYGTEFFANNPKLDVVFKETAGNAIKNSFTQGFVALTTGQDIGEAMTRGAITGGAGGAFRSTFQQFVSEDDLKFITDNTNLTAENVFNVTSFAFSQGIQASLNDEDFFESFKNSLIAGGIGATTANSISNNFSDTFRKYPKTFNKIVSTAGGLAEFYARAALEDRKVTPESLQMFFIRKGLFEVVQPTIETGVSKALNNEKEQTEVLLSKREE